MRYKMQGLMRTLAATAAALLIAVQVHAQDRPTITIAVQKLLNSNTMEPLNETSVVGSRTLTSMFDPLIDLDWKDGGKLAPALATSWERIDNSTLDLTLREGVRFHNGDEMTAEDVAFTFGQERMFGADAPKRSFARTLWPTLESVTVLGKYKVRFHTSEPDLNIENRIVRYGSQIINKRAFLEAGNWDAWSRNPIGTGPYKLKEFVPDDYLIFESHDDYWGGLPPIKTIRWVEIPEASTRVSGLIAGDFDIVTDLMPDQLDGVEKASGVKVEGGSIINHRILDYDMHHPVLKNPLVREALGYGIDRQLIADTLWKGMTTVPRGLQWEFYGDLYIDEFPEMTFDPAKVKELLAKAGYKGEEIPYRVQSDYYPLELAMAQVMVGMWQSVGLNVVLEVRENWEQIYDQSKPRGIRNWSNSAKYADPVSSIVQQHGPNGRQQTLGEWTNAEFNKLADVLVSSTDQVERRAAFKRMLEIWHFDDPGGTVIVQSAQFFGLRSNIDWLPRPDIYMNFRPGNFAMTAK